MNIQARRFDSADAALQWVEASGHGVAISCTAGNLVVEQCEADRLAAAGVEFAYLCDHAMPDGKFQIVTIPVN